LQTAVLPFLLLLYYTTCVFRRLLLLLLLLLVLLLLFRTSCTQTYHVYTHNHHRSVHVKAQYDHYYFI
jgi:hypothetical protein